MKKAITLLLVIGFNCSLFAQYEITIEAQVLDYHSKQPIPFVNIEFTNKELKTVTDKNGHFSLSYDEAYVSDTDVLQFSALGYQSEEVKASQFYKFLKNTNKIYLVSDDNRFQKATNNSVVQQSRVQEQGNIHGTISGDSIPLQGAIVRLKNKFTEAVTNTQGAFSINAKQGDVLVASFLGMKPKEVVVGANNQIDFRLESDGVVLDEVLLEGKAKKENLIDLGLGQKKNFDAIGFDVKIMTSKDIGIQYYNLIDLLTGKFAGITVGGPPPKVYIPGRQGSINNNSAAIFDINGNLYESFPPIDVQQIETITIIKSLAGATKYGSLGRGGVVVIRTKAFSGGKAAPKEKSALVQGNSYEETLGNFSNNQHTSSELLALQKASTFAEAKAIYKKQQQSEAQLGIPYYLEASDYFLKWDQPYANAVLNTISKIAFNNPKALLTLAYKLEAQHKFTEARDIYQRIAILRPKDTQTYRNLAHIYELTGYYQNAMDLYKQMLSNSMEGIDFTGLETVLANELSHLVALHRNKLNYRDLPADFLSTKFKFDTRIVFEWNEPSTEFELQFVNPIKKFYKWSHTQLEHQERMKDEVKNGYATQEYIIDDAEAGEWIINIESLTEETNTINPTYLKYTVYKNYGLPNETQEVKVVKLSDCKPKVTFDKFVYQK